MKRIWYELTRGPRRARRIRGDEQGQVIVLTAVMVFVVVIMAMITLNTSTGIYNRMRTQNAADAAADAFAVWQARGLNVVQHLNDLHYTANWVLYVAETVGCGARILCGPLMALNFTPCGCGYPACRLCCQIANPICEYSDQAQDIVSDAILGVQGFMNYAAPLSGLVAADAVAKANGADPILEVAGELVDDVLGMLGIPDGIGDIVGELGSVIDLHVLPLNFDDRAITLNIYEKDPKPTSAPWRLDQNAMRTVVLLGDASCLLCGNSPIVDDDTDGWGWEDTFYCGFPSYNTWVAGKKRWDIVGRLRRVAALNPDRGNATPEMDMYWFQDDYGTFKPSGYTPSGDDPINPPLLAFASSQVEGSPVIERSGHDDFEAYSTPRLISVHLGADNPSDDVTSALFIWH